MGTKKQRKKKLATKKNARNPRLTEIHRDTGVPGNVEQAMREGKKTIRLEDIVADRDRIDAQRAERQAAKAANANEDVAPSSSTDDRLPNNTPVWLHWPPTRSARALDALHARAGESLCVASPLSTRRARTPADSAASARSSRATSSGRSGSSTAPMCSHA